MDKGTIKRLSLLTFPVSGKGFFINKKINLLVEERSFMKNTKYFLKVFLSTAALFAVTVLLLFIFFNRDNPSSTGSKEILVQVIIPDQDIKEFTISTNALTLREALDEKKLIGGQESSYGFFITEVDGRKANDSKSEWWSITKDTEYIAYGIDHINIMDKDKYELTLMEGYE